MQEFFVDAMVCAQSRFFDCQLPSRIIPSLDMIYKREHPAQFVQTDCDSNTIDLFKRLSANEELPAHCSCQFVVLDFYVDLFIDDQTCRFLPRMPVLQSAFFSIDYKS